MFLRKVVQQPQMLELAQNMLAITGVLYSMDERILYFSCNKGKLTSDETSFINAIWSNFAIPGPGLKWEDFDIRRNGFLTYYKTAYPENTDYHDLLSGLGKTAGDGECGAFMSLLEAVLKHHNISSNRVNIESISFTEGFLVKNWKFNGNGSSNLSNYDYINVIKRVTSIGGRLTPYNRTINNEYEWVGSPEVSDLSGISGQGNETPYSDFDIHYILEIGGKFYDPSYGKFYESIEKWEEASIEAFFQLKVLSLSSGRKKYELHYRKNTSTIDVK